ncbi:hypothetical protein [Streptomyces sp. NPDC048508]|uniref:hypothetical protein n=1 Tax=Streptomyces sp. NPDC048508 TaxID=3365561 RepID=UPI003711C041
MPEIRPDLLVHDWNASNSAMRAVTFEEDFRDLLQSVRVTRPSTVERRELANMSIESGVRLLFVGFPAVSPDELDQCRDIVGYLSRTQSLGRPVLMARAVEGDVNAIRSVVQETETVALVDLYICTSSIRAVIEDKPVFEMRRRLRRVARSAAADRLPFRIAFEDSTRTEPDVLREVVLEALELGAESIVLNDTVGAAHPSGAERQVEFVREVMCRSGTHVPIAWHGHNDKGLALANALAAVSAGATQLSGTFLGIGERTGNIPLEQAMWLAHEKGHADVAVGQLRQVCEAVAQACGLDVPADQPLVGSDAFSTSTGTHTAAIAKGAAIGPRFADLVYSGVEASLLNRQQTLLLGPNSGRAAVEGALRSAHLEFADHDVTRVLEYCKRSAGVLRTTDELVAALAANTEDRGTAARAMYLRLDERLNHATGSAIGFEQLVGSAPFKLPACVDERRHRDLRGTLDTILRIWLNGDWPEDLPAPVPHPAIAPVIHDLPHAFLSPVFTRTDESLDGKIFEVQCPGGWWGIADALALETLQGRSGLAENFIAELRSLFPDGTEILHIFDSSGIPHEHWAFAQRIRSVAPEFRFRGYDRGVRTESCGFVRAHSYGAVVAEDFFNLRVAELAAGRMRYDHPPVPLFDQKISLCLPFHDATRHAFTDAQRTLFPWTAAVVDGRVQLPDGRNASLEDLVRETQTEWYLKYAGLDTTRNFGSRAVYRISPDSREVGARTADMAIRESRAGKPWLLQEAVGSAEPVTYVGRSGAMRTESMFTKVSVFDGPSRTLGALLQSSRTPCVRATAETVLSVTTETR